MLVASVRALLLLFLAFLAVFGQVHISRAEGADISHESLDFSGCFPSHQFDVCAEISGVRHQVVTPSGRAVTGFTERSCFTVTEFGEFVSERCQTEHLTTMSVDGLLIRSHDSGYMEFSDGVQTCSGHFHSQIENGAIVIDDSDIVCT